MDGLKNKDGAMRRGGRARLAVQLLLAALIAGGFMLLNVNAGPLVKMDFIGGWETRRVYIALCGAVLLLAMTVLALQRRGWAEYAVMAGALLAGALMRFYMIDLISPYYADGLAPFLRAMEDGLNGLRESGYTPLTVLIFKAFLHTGVYPMYCVKLFSIGCDLLIALALAALWGEDPRAKVATVLYLFCPVFFLYGAYAGTMDSAYVLLVVLCALALQREKRALGWALFGAAFALDPMSLAALPVLLLWKGRRRDRALLCAPVCCAVLSLPAILQGMPVSGAMRALLLGGRNAQSMHVRSSSIYNFFAPVWVKDTQPYHVMRYMEGVDGNALVNELFTLDNLLSLRCGFMIAFAALFGALMVIVFRRRAQLAVCHDALFALLPLVFCLFLPGVDAACFILSDLGMLLYALRVRGGWRAAALSLGACAVSAVAFATGAELISLWLCMAAQGAALFLLAREVICALRQSGALGTADAPERI